MRPSLRAFIAIRAADELACQMLNVAFGWRVYAATHNPMSLAYVGLAQFLPNIAMLLIAGQAADRFDRRKVIRLALGAQALALAVFAAASAVAAPSAKPVYLLLIVLGSARAFTFPSMSALLPRVVSAAEFPRAVAATSSVCQICAIAGPAIGGLIYSAGGDAVFWAAAALYFVAVVETRRVAISHPAVDPRPHPPAAKGMLAGIRYIRSNRLLLALTSLDLFAVLLGGVTALLPIYARDILAAGPVGLGCLRCAPGIGAALVGFLIARMPHTVERSAGSRMLACVAGFGFATVIFAVSANFWLSLAALAAAGGFDMVSMVIRQALIQISTPDAMRGRVSAVNGVFIGASSELGEFESGATAALFGVVPSAVIGGLGTLAVVALWAAIFPELRGAFRKNESLYASPSGDPPSPACAPLPILAHAPNRPNSAATN
ncbi:MAG: MFS transporter [Bryobacteraceae bacterium]